MLKCIIVDDEESAIEVLKLHLEEIDSLELVLATTNPFEAAKIIDQQPIDLAFLDIQMPGISGLELARTLHGKCKIIFTTAHSGFVSDAFDLDIGVLDYLLKPISLPRFMRAIQRAINMLAPVQGEAVETEAAVTVTYDSIEHDYIFVKTEQKGKMLKIALKQIDYVEGMGKYVAIHHAGQKTLALLTMKEMEDKLPSKYFIRVQKSFIVAKHKIAMVEGNRVVLQNITAEITLGDMYKAQFMDAMKEKILQ